MVLFQKNVNSDLLVAIEYIKVLFTSNYGLESVIYDISNKKFGHVTGMAKSALSHVRGGKTLQESLMIEKAANQNKNMLYFISALGGVSTQDILRRLDDVGKHIIAEKKIYVDNFIDNLKAKMGWIIMLAALPLLIYFLTELSTDLFSEMFKSFTPAIKQNVCLAAISLSALGIFAVLIMLRYRE
jgi:hypothetical protein